MPLTKEQIIEARDDLAKFNGDPPHDRGSNICYGDGYFANSLVCKYGTDLENLAEITGYTKIMKKYRKKKMKLDRKLLKELTNV